MVDRNSDIKARQRPIVSWGALFAGLAFIVAVAWMLFLLGSAIGISVVDVSNLAAVGNGLSLGAAIWILVSTLIVFFLGALFTARLAGGTHGILHGIALWSVGTTTLLLLGALGVSGLIQAGASVIQGAGSAIGAASSAVPKGASLSDIPLMNKAVKQLKGQAAQTIAQSEQQSTKPQSQRASKSDIRNALNQIDEQTFKKVATNLMQGNTQGAKDALASNTNLSDKQITTIVGGLSKQAQQLAKQAKQQIAKKAETASTYLQAAAWVTFIAALLGFIAALLGGWLGSEKRDRREAAGAR